MPWNTFWLLFVQVALALALLSPFVAFFLWMTVGAVISRVTESRAALEESDE